MTRSSWSRLVLAASLVGLMAAGAVGAQQLLFADDFERAELGEDWVSGTDCAANSIRLVGGRVESTENCNYIETTREFSGDLVVSVDAGKVLPSATYASFDVRVGLTGAVEGTVRFDEAGVDAIDLGGGVGAARYTLPAAEVDRGTAVLTYSQGQAWFSWVNTAGRGLVTERAPAGGPGSMRVRIYVAGMAGPGAGGVRYVDRVRVVSLAPAAGQGAWQLTNGPFEPVIQALSVNPADLSEWLVGGWGDQGVYLTTDGGQTFGRVGVEGGDARLWRHPSDPDVVVSRMQRSADGGRTWVWHGGGAQACAAAPSDPDRLYTFASPGDPSGGWIDVYLSSDRGASFQQVGSFGHSSSNKDLWSASVDAATPDRVYAVLWEIGPSGNRGRAYRSQDGGITWGALSAPEQQVLALACDPVVPGRVLLLGQDALYRSVDGGQSWNPVASLNAGWPDPGQAQLQYGYEGTREVWLSAYAGVWRSTDGGDTWSQISVPWPMPGGRITLSPSTGQPGWALASDAESIYRTEDGGQTWTSLGAPPMPATAWQVAADPDDPGRAYAGSCCGGELFATADGGSTWERTFDRGVNGVYPRADDPAQVYLASNNQAYRSEDHGQTWTQLGDFLAQTGTTGSDFVSALALSPEHPQTVFIGAGGYDWLDPNDPTSRGNVFVSTDQGANWQLYPFPEANWAIAGIAAVMDEPDALVVATSDRGIFRTTDAGQTWTQVSGVSFWGGRHMLAPRWQADPQSGVILAAGPELLISSDAGVTWQARSAILGWAPGPVAITHPAPSVTRLLAAAQSPSRSLYVSDDLGISWTTVRTGIDDGLVALSVAGDGTVYAATSHSGVAKGRLAGALVVSPNGGELWTTGSTQEIRWLVDPAAQEVRIEYSLDAGETWADVVASTPDDGSYEWVLPAEASPLCLVRLSNAAGGDVGDVSEGVFCLTAPPREYTIPELSDADLATLDLHDGSVADWEAILGPPQFTMADFLALPDVGDAPTQDPADLDCRIWVGWNQASNRVYVAMERIDDVYINEYPGGSPGDIWQYDSMEFMVDGDRSGGDYAGFGDASWSADEHRLNSYRTAQQYQTIADTPDDRHLGHLYVDIDWQVHTGADWVTRPPFADGGGGSSGSAPTTSVTEFYVTPFDNLVWDDPAGSAASPLFAEKQVGLQIAVPDFDTSPAQYHSFSTLNGQVAVWRDADRFVEARLVGTSGEQPLPPRLRVNWPNGGQDWGWGQTQRIQWFADRAIEAVRIDWSWDDGASWAEVVSNTVLDVAGRHPRR